MNSQPFIRQNRLTLWNQFTELVPAYFIIKAFSLAIIGLLTFSAVIIELIPQWNLRLLLLLLAFTATFTLSFLYQLIYYPLIEQQATQKKRHTTLMLLCFLQLLIALLVIEYYGSNTSHPYVALLITLLPAASMGCLSSITATVFLLPYNATLYWFFADQVPGHYFLFLVSGQLLIWLLFSSMIHEFEQKTQSNLNLIQLKATQDLLRKQTQQKTQLEIAQNLHDELGHLNTLLHSQLQTFAATQQQTPAELEKALQTAEEMKQQIRNIAFQMRPQNFDLKSALEQLSKNITKPAIRLQWHSPQQDLSSQISEVIFRACQETITNSIRHSNANQITIQVEQQTDFIRVSIMDNGTGNEEALILGSGLKTIQQRVQDLSGTATLRLDQTGFHCELRIPL